MSDTEAALAAWRRPTPWSQTVFRFKALAYQGRRAVQDVLSAVPRLAREPANGFDLIVARCVTPLEGGVPVAEQIYELGKIENLRQAARRLDGVVIPADRVFSFWRHVGPATAARGFVLGRMLQEGCLVPAVGGGLCQMSNALFEVALASGSEIVERHRHSRQVPGSAAALGRDATVAWNYVDFRFRPRRDLRISVSLAGGQLEVSLAGRQADGPLPNPTLFHPDASAPTARSCATCDEVDCYRHEDRP